MKRISSTLYTSSCISSNLLWEVFYELLEYRLYHLALKEPWISRRLGGRPVHEDIFYSVSGTVFHIDRRFWDKCRFQRIFFKGTCLAHSGWGCFVTLHPSTCVFFVFRPHPFFVYCKNLEIRAVEHSLQKLVKSVSLMAVGFIQKVLFSLFHLLGWTELLCRLFSFCVILIYPDTRRSMYPDRSIFCESPFLELWAEQMGCSMSRPRLENGREIC